jgi:hypothetical protein
LRIIKPKGKGGKPAIWSETLDLPFDRRNFWLIPEVLGVRIPLSFPSPILV